MIVKNEADVIERCLDSVLPHIDYWVISDTGSTDGTPDIILEKMRPYRSKGQLIYRPWVDYSHNRNEALRLAMCWASHVLVMDASDVFEGELEFSPLAHALVCQHQMGPTTWWRRFLVSSKLEWKYVGRVHEVLTSPCVVADGVVQSCRIHCNVGGVFQGKEYFMKQVQLLEGETDPRSIFYLAQALQNAGELERARAMYELRATMREGYVQERYVAAINAGLLSEGEARANWFALARCLDRTRPEANLYLALEWLGQENEQEARDFLREAIQCEPVGALFLDTSARGRAMVCLAMLDQDPILAREIVNTPGMEYPKEIYDLGS